MFSSKWLIESIVVLYKPKDAQEVSAVAPASNQSHPRQL